MISIMMLGLFVLSFLLGIPVSVRLIISASAAMLPAEDNLISIPQRMTASVRGLKLMVIPFFVLAGHLMLQLGMKRKIFEFADTASGWVRGGLDYANVLADFALSRVCGAAITDTTTLGSIAMK